MSDQPLTPLQIRFVEEYLKDTGPEMGRQTRAAKRAGYSITSAKNFASELMKNERIRKMISLAGEEGAERLGLTAERVLQELQLIAFAKVDGLTVKDADGNDTLAPSSAPQEVIVNTVSGKSKSKSVTVKTVKLSDKISALEKLGKYLDLFTDKVEINSTSLIDLIEQSMKPREVPQLEPIQLKASV